MQGQFLVTPVLAPQTLVEADISREPTDLPSPIGKRDPKTIRLDLFTVVKKAGSRRRQRSATGRSTERYRDHSSAFALAIPLTFISRIRPTAV
jgi:hypothetical protein